MLLIFFARSNQNKNIYVVRRVNARAAIFLASPSCANFAVLLRSDCDYFAQIFLKLYWYQASGRGEKRKTRAVLSWHIFFLY